MIFLESLQPFCLKTSQLSNCCTLSSPVESLAILGTCFYRSGPFLSPNRGLAEVAVIRIDPMH